MAQNNTKRQQLMDEISEVKNNKTHKVIFYAGILGLFFFVGPGVILILISTRSKRAKRNKLALLERELSMLDYIDSKDN